MKTVEQSAGEDYRQSHADKGADYDKFIAETPFDSYMAEWERRHLRAILPGLLGGGPGRHLDFACGTGRIVVTVAPLCTESVGVDISPSMIEIAKRKCPRVRFVNGDITAADIDLGGQFDVVTAFRFFGNAQDDLRATVLDRLNGYLRDGGYLVLNSHRNPNAIKNLLHRLTGGADQLDLTYGRLLKLLRNHGFQSVACYPIGFWIFRNGLAARTDLTADAGEKFERAFRHRWFARFSPDLIMVARKVCGVS